MEEKITVECVKLTAEVDKNLDGLKEKSLNLKPMLDVCVGSVISSLVLGHSYDFDDVKFVELKHAMDRTMDLLAHPSILMLDSFPWLRFIPFYGRLGYDEMIMVNRKFLNMISAEIADHKKNIDHNLEPTDFTEAYLLGNSVRKTKFLICRNDRL